MTLVFFAVLALLMFLAQRYTGRAALRTLRCGARFAVPLADPDEHFAVETVAENPGWLPVLYLRITERLPAALHFADEGAMRGQVTRDDWRGTEYSAVLYLMPRQRVTHTETAVLPARGRYPLRELHVSVGDFLGVDEAHTGRTVHSEIVIAPPRAAEGIVDRALGGFLGDVSVRRFLLEDPILTVGVRDYTGREPQKDIAWRQSARLGRLVVKEYDHTVEPLVTVLFNVEYTASPPVRAAAVERCLSLARTACELLERRHVPYRFCTNVAAASAIGPWSEIENGLGQRHFDAVRDGLGRTDGTCRQSLAALVAQEAARSEAGRGYFVVTPPLAPAQRRCLDGLRALTGGALEILQGEAQAE